MLGSKQDDRKKTAPAFFILGKWRESREATHHKISQSPLWQIAGETNHYVRLKPLEEHLQL